MNRRRRFTVLGALAAIVVLSGCVEQPFDESQLQSTEDPGVAAAPLSNRQARRAAQNARQAQAQAPRGRTGTARQPGSGGDGAGASSPAASDDTSSTPDQPGSGDDSGGAPAGGDDTGATPGRPAAPARPSPYRVVGTYGDRAGDPSGQSPAYADIRQLLVESDGTNARVTVAVAGRIPRKLADGEVQGIGIDFYRSNARESDFQLFVDGGADGWLAYLHGPTGVAAYSGQFAVGGRVLVFTLPWRLLGGARPARVSMFIDWAHEGPLLAEAGNDRAPEDGRMSIDPR